MIFRKYISIIFCAALLVFSDFNFGFSQSDSSKILSVSEYVEIVKQFHPLAKQALLIPQRAKAELLIAHGGWDPRLVSDYNEKVYKNNSYYSYFESKITVPTWYGIEINAGYDFAEGNYLNPESTLPNNGLGYVGILLPLGKNLFLDKQRAALKQAKLFLESSEQQRVLILNDLLLNALIAYYDWSYSYNEYSIFKEAVRVAQIRFDATKIAVKFGDRAAIDTTEALTQLQSRKFQFNDAVLRYLNAGIELSNYLWLENDVPRGIDTTIVPAALQSDFLQDKIELYKLEELTIQIKQSHPELLNYDFKLSQLNVERKLKIEDLKPSFNIKYNLLTEQLKFNEGIEPIYTNNFRLGLNFSMPLTFKQGRGSLKLTNLKIQETKFSSYYKQQELINKLKTYYNELIILQQQTELYEQTIYGYKQLLDGENVRLNNGESSLFLVNARENRYLESKIKLCELQTKYFKTEASLKWALGNLSN